MPTTPLAVLKKGLSRLSKHVESRKNELVAKQGRKEKLSEAEEQWLDNEGNTVDAMDDPIARKVDSLLSIFNRQLRLDETQSLKDSSLMDYFKP